MLTTEKITIDTVPGHVPSEEELEPTAGMLPREPAATPAPLRALASAVDWAVIGIGGLMVTLVFANVLTHVAGHDIAWTVELCELAMVSVTFLGGASAAHRGAHMAITEFLDKLGESRRRLADASIQLIALATLAVLAWYGWNIANASWGNVLTVLQVPMALQYLALPIGATLSFVFVAHDLILILAGKSREERYGVHH